jgi:hypothetical protein
MFSSYLYTRHHTTLPLKTYRRTIGINHGLPMASMLGQIYLNQIDDDIDFVPLVNEFAVRHEDDLLIISPHRYRLRRIQRRMTEKLNELHRIHHPSTISLKTKTNIRHRTMNKYRPVEYWGSLVDICSREILVHINTSDAIEKKMRQLTIKLTRNTGQHLRHSLINALCLRSHAYYFDRIYTSNRTLVKNFYLLTKYFLQRLHGMCTRFSQIYSNDFIRSKSLFIFRTIRSALRLLMKKIFVNDRKSLKLKQQCKYVFFLATLHMIRTSQHLFIDRILNKRCLHMMNNLKYVNKSQRHHIQQWIGYVRTTCC